MTINDPSINPFQAIYPINILSQKRTQLSNASASKLGCRSSPRMSSRRPSCTPRPALNPAQAVVPLSLRQDHPAFANFRLATMDENTVDTSTAERMHHFHPLSAPAHPLVRPPPSLEFSRVRRLQGVLVSSPSYRTRTIGAHMP